MANTDKILDIGVTLFTIGASAKIFGNLFETVGKGKDKMKFL